MGISSTKAKYWLSDTDHIAFGPVQIIQPPNAPVPNLCIRVKLNSDPKSEESIAYWENLLVYDPDGSSIAVPVQINHKGTNYDTADGVLELIFDNYSYKFDSYVKTSTANNPFIYEIVLLNVIGSMVNALYILKKAGYKHFCVSKYTILMKSNGNWLLCPPMPTKRNLMLIHNQRIKEALKKNTPEDKRGVGLMHVIPPEISSYTLSTDSSCDIYSLGITILDSISPTKDTNSVLDQTTIFNKIKALTGYYSTSFLYLLTRMTQTDPANRISIEELITSLEVIQQIKIN